MDFGYGLFVSCANGVSFDDTCIYILGGVGTRIGLVLWVLFRPVRNGVYQSASNERVTNEY